MNENWSFIYHPSSTASTYSTMAFSSAPMISTASGKPYEIIKPVTETGYEEKMDDIEGANPHLWVRKDYGLNILLRDEKVRYSVYKGNKVSFFELTYSEVGRLSTEEICRRIISCELEVDSE